MKIEIPVDIMNLTEEELKYVHLFEVNMKNEDHYDVTSRDRLSQPCSFHSRAEAFGYVEELCAARVKGANLLSTLSAEEVQLILSRREKEAKKRLVAAFQGHVLRVAGGYLAWLYDHGAGSSFSTFTDEFGYELPVEFDHAGIARDEVFLVVGDLLSASHDSMLNRIAYFRDLPSKGRS